MGWYFFVCMITGFAALNLAGVVGLVFVFDKICYYIFRKLSADKTFLQAFRRYLREQDSATSDLNPKTQDR